jgi:hypothetical protein
LILYMLFTVYSLLLKLAVCISEKYLYWACRP